MRAYVAGTLILQFGGYGKAAMILSGIYVGIAIGSEWATGSSMMAELWPDHM
jgi:hypothetical protein